jgi:predicted GIY-YIG superfamily endonuclease
MSRPRKHGIYLLHFEPRYKHAGHYLGFSDDIPSRVRDHRDGKSGVRMCAAAAAAGCQMFLVRTWAGGRKDERRLKGGRNNGRRGSLARLCPACISKSQHGGGDGS